MADKKKFFEAVSILIGMTIGAGILGIPYVVAKTGYLIGAITILVVGFVLLIINLCMGEICLRTKGDHQMTGYAEKYLGKSGKILMLISVIIGFYGALIAYIIGEGESFGAIFNYNPFVFSMMFFVLMTILLYFGIRTMGESELFLTIAKIVLFILIIGVSIFALKSDNLKTINLAQIFVPYGVILFAFTGSAAIPEMKEVLAGEGKNLKKAILLGMGIITIVYLIFTLIVIGVSGQDVSEVATLRMAEIVGSKMLILGGVFAIIAMATSYLAVGFAIKETYVNDLKLNHFFSWFLASFIPLVAYLLLYLMEKMSFINIIGICGAISGVLSFVLIILMHQKAKKNSDKNPEYSINITKLQASLMICFLVLASMVYLTSYL